MFNYWTIARVSHASKIMLKILQARLQQYAIWELPDIQAGFRKGRGTRGQTVNVCWIIEKAREFQKMSTSPLTTQNPLCGSQQMWKNLKKAEIPNHFTCLLRNLHVGQEGAVRTLHGRTDWFKIGKGVRQGYRLSPYLFNLCAEYI